MVKPHAFGPCDQCEATLGKSVLDLERHIEYVTDVGDLENGIPQTVKVVNYSGESFKTFCNHHCWQQNEQKTIAALRLRSVYPDDAVSVVAHVVAAC